ncbi:MAG: T9SS type A sorting domain-containing protein [Bacteroidetes bacterium]|nr:T9SS type A sorting domain-containing protein [Bacteroidota bacterium]
MSYSNYGITSIFESINGGLNWQSVEGNLPDMPVRGIMLHPDSNDMAFIATELGVWSTTNLNGDSTEWTQTNSALANVSVDELQYRASDHVIAAATHGRGLFTATIPHTPNLNFDALVLNTKEISADTASCYSFKDYTVNAMTSQLLTLPITANIIINAGATAISPLDFEYTTNGSFTLPSHQVIFSGSTNTIPVTIRVYDDKVYEPTAEMFSLVFDSISANALPGIHNECAFTIADNDDNPLLVRGALWTEDFESGTNPPLLWNLEGVDVNQWGNQNFACGSTINNFTMQVYNTTTNSCGYDNTATSLAVVSRMVDATASSSIQVAFDWISEGESGYDWGELVYSTDTLTPTWISVPGTPVFNSSTAVTRSAFDLPASVDGTKFLIGWLWTNDYAVGGLSMGIDNIELSGLIDRKIENTLAIDNEYLGPNGASYYYNVDGDLICSIENLSSHDFGCTMVEIDRSGNAAQFLIGETDTLKKVFDKTFRVIPTNNAAANFAITLYATNAEVAGFESQGRTLIKDGKLFETTDSVSLATIYTPRDTATALTQNVYLDGYAIRGEFNTTLGGFGIGNPGKAKWSVNVTDISKGEISIYPNPAGNECWIKTSEKTNFKLINSVGQLIERFTVDGSKQINLKHLASGLYIIQSETNKQYFKLIKQ